MGRHKKRPKTILEERVAGGDQSLSLDAKGRKRRKILGEGGGLHGTVEQRLKKEEKQGRKSKRTSKTVKIGK